MAQVQVKNLVHQFPSLLISFIQDGVGGGGGGGSKKATLPVFPL